MKIEYLDVQDLIPTQPSVKLRNFRDKLSAFNPDYFDPISVCFDSGRPMIVNGHHRASLIHIASRFSNLGSKIPISIKNRFKSSLPIFAYSQRKADSLDEMFLEINSGTELRLSELFVRDQDVYVSINGSSQYLFTLPDIELLERAKTKYLVAA